MATREAKTYTVRSRKTGATVEVTGERWLTAASDGARALGCEVRDVEVKIDKRVGFVSPTVVTH